MKINNFTFRLEDGYLGISNDDYGFVGTITRDEALILIGYLLNEIRGEKAEVALGEEE